MPDAIERCEQHGHVTKWRTSVMDKKTGQTVQIGPVHTSPCQDCISTKKRGKSNG